MTMRGTQTKILRLLSRPRWFNELCRVIGGGRRGRREVMIVLMRLEDEGRVRSRMVYSHFEGPRWIREYYKSKKVGR